MRAPGAGPAPTIFMPYGLALTVPMGYRIIRASRQEVLQRLAAGAERAAEQADDKVYQGRTTPCAIASSDRAT